MPECRNAGMSECRNAGEKLVRGIGIFTGSELSQSDIGIPASGSTRYRWSWISPALPSYVKYLWFTKAFKA